MRMIIKTKLRMQQQQIVEKLFEERWLKFNSGILFMNNNFILGSLEVHDYMDGVRSRKKMRHRRALKLTPALQKH